MKCLNRTRTMLEAFRNIDPRIASETILTFIVVAQRPGITRRELETRTGMSNSAVCRHANILSKKGDPARLGNKPGLDLIFSQPDDLDSRVFRAYLTPKGVRLRDKLVLIEDGLCG